MLVEISFEISVFLKLRDYQNRIGQRDASLIIYKIIDDMRAFLLPHLLAAGNEETFNRSWVPGGV